jgi:hypothetical protein
MFGQRSLERRMQTMNATQGECLQIDRPDQPRHSPPVENLRPAEISAPTDGPLPENASEVFTPRNLLRGRLIVIGFVAAAPIAIGAWLWLLGWAALTLL